MIHLNVMFIMYTEPLLCNVYYVHRTMMIREEVEIAGLELEVFTCSSYSITCRPTFI